MTSSDRERETVPGFLFAAGLADAVRFARTGHGAFVDCFDVNVDFTIHPGGTDVRVVGLGEDDPDSEYRVVGDTEYRLAHRYDTNTDGPPLVTQQWTTTDLTGEREWTTVGTPLGLIEGILPDGDVEVVSRDEDSTTYKCLLSIAAIQKAVGENVRGEGYDGSEPGVDTRIVIDAAGLPRSIHPHYMHWPFTFSGWGTTPLVTAPDASTMSWLDWEISGHTPPEES
ncbi:hypothetical protein [Marmoricola sp. URHB0036]|uniref:hypothetical protein n=1 Tax=Marmoricola sp. URHB0036 TaxID=1298863 RepID=UPI00048525E3|nr:hypothetical protein [Marmoricola sp. URHB0036]